MNLTIASQQCWYVETDLKSTGLNSHSDTWDVWLEVNIESQIKHAYLYHLFPALYNITVKGTALKYI